MAGKKEVEKCSEGLVLLTNVLLKELKKMVEEAVAEAIDVSIAKLNPVQSSDSKPVVSQFDGCQLIRLPEVLEYLPVSKSTWWAGVKSGRYPPPVTHLGPRITAWRKSEILNLISKEIPHD